jgi:hypothetical protein
MPWPAGTRSPAGLAATDACAPTFRMVADLVGPCDEVHIHSAVFDTEAINYFLRALPPAVGARTMKARILPDGLISIRRYPLSPIKRLLQCLRKLRQGGRPRVGLLVLCGRPHWLGRALLRPHLRAARPAARLPCRQGGDTAPADRTFDLPPRRPPQANAPWSSASPWWGRA